MSGISVIGATTWGSTLAALIAANGLSVRVWSNKRDKADALQIASNAKRGSNNSIEFTVDADYATDNCDLTIFAVPAQSLRRTAKLFSSKLKSSTVLVSASKGLEADSGKRMTEILAEEIKTDDKGKVAVISGPNLSKEINLGLPAVTVVASSDLATAKKISAALSSGNFSVHISSDVRGVEICGALKNVIALGAGMVDGLGLGSNAKAALVTVGWQEAIKLGKELGANEETFYGFAGLGDLVTTCISPLSRNYRVGFEIAKGKSIKTAVADLPNVVEGVDTTKATHLLTINKKLDLPLMEAIYRVLSGLMPPQGISVYFLDGHKPL
jgi:glycerol-3-phosphate dehydrogenase (NAD(P)+)